MVRFWKFNCITKMILSTHGIIQSKAAAAPPSGIITTGLVFYVDTENSSSYTGNPATTINLTNGSLWNDLSGLGNNAVAANTPAYDAAQKAMYMSGGGAYFNLPNKTNFPTGAAARSIGGWYKMNSISNYMGVICYGNREEIQNFEIMSLDGMITFGGWNADYKSNIAFTLNTWLNICITYDGTTIRIYVNSVNGLIQVRALNTPLTGGFIGLHINGTNSANMYNRMNYLYNFALSDQQVLDNFNNTKARFGL